MIEQARSRENFLMSGCLSRRRVLQGVAGLAAVGVPRSKASAQEPAKSKTVYLSFLLHGNMCYDRYTKQEIREKFPRIYATGVRALKAYPEVTAHIDFPGLTLLSLKRYAPGFLEELKPLVDCRQVAMVGCQYAASHALASDEESDLVASRVSMELMRRELQPDCSAFFPQEIVFHPQMPYVMNQIGVRRLIVMPDGWDRPRRVQGIDGSAVDVFPLDLRTIRLGQLEAYYDAHADGSFIMAGGDFEQLGDIGAYVAEIARLAQKGKIIRWTTVERYAQEVGIHVTCAAPHPFGQAKEDREPSPSFSRWTSHPMDMSWHGHAVKALDCAPQGSPMPRLRFTGSGRSTARWRSWPRTGRRCRGPSPAARDSGPPPRGSSFPHTATACSDCGSSQARSRPQSGGRAALCWPTASARG